MLIDPTVRQIGSVRLAQDVRIGPFCVIGAKDFQVVRNSANTVTTIGKGTQLESHVVVGQGATIGCDCWVDHHCYVGCDTDIGNRVEIMYAARIYHRVIVDDGAWIAGFACNDAQVGAEAIIMGNLMHRFCDAKEDEPEPAPSVGTRAFIGMGASVIGGVRIGDGAYIAAGAVVTHDVPPKRLFAGVPARDIGKAPNPFHKWRTA